MDDHGALSFAQRVIALIDAGHKSATYKLATLIALMDVCAEATDPTTGPPEVLSGRRVAQRVVELYWPQTSVYGVDASGAPIPLSQSSQNDIPAKLAARRARLGLDRGATITEARRADDAWDTLESELVAIIIAMPIPKLQRFGEGRFAFEDRFIYDFNWPDEVHRSRIERNDFDDRLVLRPEVGRWLIQLAPLLRPLVQAKWIEFVARRNQDLVDVHQLTEFLFGASRVTLQPVRSPLFDAQKGLCFYCGFHMSAVDVDHFIPWSRHPDNSLDNLVAAHPACNNAKAASIASVRHLKHWIDRVRGPVLAQVHDSTGWPRRIDRTLGAVSATYLCLPDGAQLWAHGLAYEAAGVEEIRAALSVA